MVQRQPVGIGRQTIVDNIVMLTSPRVCVHVLCTHTHARSTKSPDCLMQRRYIIAPSPIKGALKVICNYIRSMLDTIELPKKYSFSVYIYSDQLRIKEGTQKGKKH